MTSEQLRALGRALFGDTWQTNLSRELEVSDRQVRRWATGAPIPAGVVSDLIELAEGRAHALTLMARELRTGDALPDAPETD